MNVLSLFDGMSCGQIALERAGIKIDNYYASEWHIELCTYYRVAWEVTQDIVYNADRYATVLDFHKALAALPKSKHLYIRQPDICVFALGFRDARGTYYKNDTEEVKNNE